MILIASRYKIFKGLQGFDLGAMLDVLKKAKDGSLKSKNINAMSDNTQKSKIGIMYMMYKKSYY